jgi:hypothetical protein
VACAHIRGGRSVNTAFQLAGDSLALTRRELNVLTNIPCVGIFEASGFMNDSFHAKETTRKVSPAEVPMFIGFAR